MHAQAISTATSNTTDEQLVCETILDGIVLDSLSRFRDLPRLELDIILRFRSYKTFDFSLNVLMLIN